MPWRFEISKNAQKQFTKLDAVTQHALVTYMTRLKNMEDPTLSGTMLTGKFAGLWRYRVGKYRLICELRKNILTIEVITIDKRDTVYR